MTEELPDEPFIVIATYAPVRVDLATILVT